MSSLNVYIDGACSNNGQKFAKAGYGVYFGENDKRNQSGLVIGKQSNNTGELTAFIKCFEILKDKIQKREQTINIHTDSEYVIKCATTYGAKLEKQNWISSKPIPNLELVKLVYTLFKGSGVKLHYIAAHTNKTDIHSIGNEGADRLACLAIGTNPEKKARTDQTELPKKNQIQEIKLEWVNFDNKDKAKELGAKWNMDGKYWYVTPDLPEENVKKLKELMKQIMTASPAKETTPKKKKYIKIEFAKKDIAKKLGAKWDPGVKSWYYILDETSPERQSKLDNL